MLKCSSERCVWAPQSLSAGTSTAPMLSVSRRNSVICVLLNILELQDLCSVSSNAPGQRRIVDERHAIGGDDFLQLWQPRARLQLIREARLQHLGRDEGGG